MFEISREVVENFSKLGDVHKEIYLSWLDSLKKFDKFQLYSDYGYLKERMNYAKY